MTLQIKMAAELVDPELEARWTTRRAADLKLGMNPSYGPRSYRALTLK